MVPLHPGAAPAPRVARDRGGPAAPGAPRGLEHPGFAGGAPPRRRARRVGPPRRPAAPDDGPQRDLLEPRRRDPRLRDVMIRLPVMPEFSSAQLSETVLDALREADSSVEMRRVEFVGPQVGKELLENGALALLFVSLGIVAYLAVRFEWKFGVAGILANMHDVIIILGFFAFFQWEFSLTVLAAVLAILGYSVNESVVIFDRIRENFRKLRKVPVEKVINNAITRTMARTIITHGSTQMVVITMLLFGGEVLFYFALALTIGIWFGIYSSIMVASSTLMLFGVKREDLVRPEEKKPENDGAVV